MRWKIIVANAGIVLILGLVTYVMLATSLTEVVQNEPRARTVVAQSVRAANARLALDALQMERWLDQSVRADAVHDVFGGGTIGARQESATVQANKIRDEALQSPLFRGLTPSLVLFLDAHGVALGRNGSGLMRGERVGDIYPSIKSVLSDGKTLSDVWVHQQRQEQMLVSLAAVRGEGNAILGAVAIGVPLSDDRMQRTSELTSGQALMFGVEGEKGVEVVARGGTVPSDVLSQLSGANGLQSAKLARASRDVDVPQAQSGDWVYGVGVLEGFANDKTVVVAAVPTSLVPSLNTLLMPIFGVTALGLILVFIVGSLIGNYLSRPISELEDGILAIINGNQTIRFQIEHPELGGLVFRINSLLNALMGVQEDDTDEQGRPSASPTSQHFQEALAVDESFITSKQAKPEVVRALASEPPDDYYKRIFREYLEAKRGLGDPVDGIEFRAFIGRVQENERELSDKYHAPVRHQLEVRDGAVVLVAIPLA
ncbi:MAG TPA: MXAN_5187 C-terminal domain-containing protein [Polyangiaceae bacterium]|nr:MXAN_5187 C-terminal domain-containing protein [Polyangiaceae bacterium]